MAVRVEDMTGPVGAGSTAADPDLLARILRYTGLQQPSSVPQVLQGPGLNVPPALSSDAAAAAQPASIMAASVTQAPNPLTNPSPVPAALQGGGPPVPASLTGPPSPTPWFPSSNTPMPWQVPPVAMPARPVTPTPATAYPATAALPARPVTPTPATAYPPGDPNRWLIERQNAPATMGQPQRGFQTALDLSGLFGGGRANPADVPAANARPMSGGPLSKGSKMAKNYGPYTQDQAAGRSLKQRYG